jgi:peptide/nickel transport system substrate-binding protein
MQYAFDPNKAKALLAEAGYPKGFEAEIVSFPVQGFPLASTLVQAIAGYWENIGVRTKIAVMDYGAARKKWFDRSMPGALTCFNLGNRDEYGEYAALTKFTAFDKPTGTMHDPEIDKLVAAMGAETNPTKWAELMVSAYRRLRAESLGISIVDIDTPYAIGKSLPTWDLGNVMYDMNLEQIVKGK